jgi:four helix bundle protein
VKNEIIARMKNLSLEIIRLVDRLPATQTAGILGKQIVRSSTSIGANYRSACRARSRADFVSKVAIAEEECDETQYWLDLLHECGLVGYEEFRRLNDEADQLTAILVASGKTARQR